MLRRWSWFAFSFLWLLACDNTSNRAAPMDASHPVDRPVLTDSAGRVDMQKSDAYQCNWPSSLNTSACVPLRAYVQCTSNGNSSSYPSTDPSMCPGCTGTCKDFCKATEFALSCTGHPADAAATPADPFYGCTVGYTTPSGSVIYCCPCQ
jgi:hypothetical protein